MTLGAAPAPGQFDHYARLVRRLLDVPVALVSLVEPDRQWFPGMSGLGGPYGEARETPLSHSFCQYVVKDERPLIISDARLDRRLAGNLAIEDLDVIAYAGWPLVGGDGRTIGSLCAIDSDPREWTREQIETLEDLAAACSAELDEHQRRARSEAALGEAERLGERSRALLALSTALASTETLADVAGAVSRVSTDELGCERAGIWLRPGAAALSSDPLLPGHEPEELHLVDHYASAWRSAALFARLPLDHSNPLGSTLLDEHAIFFADRAEQDRRYPAVVNPHQVGQARAFMPLMAGGRVFGVLVLVWPTIRTFTDEDRITIAALATYTAQAVQRAQLLEERTSVALTLQTAMLTRLPQPDHLRIAARYLPAGEREQVGGDWYDAVVMPSGATHLVIGDVEGHDISAAAVMGQLRSMLRMATWMSDSPPSDDLARLDRAMEDLGVDTRASVVLARIEQTVADEAAGIRRLRWSNAGHLPPVLVTADGSARLLDGPSDPLLGLLPGVARHDHEVEIIAESTLLLYTDGLVERRGESLDVGLSRLLATVGSAASLEPADFLDAVLDRLARDAADDDVAVLAVRFGAEV